MLTTEFVTYNENKSTSLDLFKINNKNKTMVGFQMSCITGGKNLPSINSFTKVSVSAFLLATESVITSSGVRKLLKVLHVHNKPLYFRFMCNIILMNLIACLSYYVC